MAEISDVKTESSPIKTEIPEVKSECSKTKTDLEKVKQTQTEMVRQVKKLKQEIKDLHEEKETVQLDIDQLHEEFENKLDMITDIDDELDRLERENRKSTMRIFGLAEEPDERNLDAKRIVTQKVLKVACSGEDWSPDDIQRAYRVGESKDGQPRLMLVTFRYCDDKFRVYDGRDILRKNGIRVSDDLTKRQRQKLKDLKAKGYTGYFYKGQVHVRGKKVKRETINKDRSKESVDEADSVSSKQSSKQRRLQGETVTTSNPVSFRST